MADQQRGAGNAMFGFTNPSSEAPTPAPAAPQPPSVYYAPPAPVSSGPGTLVVVVLVVLAALAGVNLYMLLQLKQDYKDTVSHQEDQLNVLTRRADSSDEAYAQLKARFEVTSQKLGMTQQELAHAKSLASDIQTQQKAAVQQLSQAIAQKASADQVNQVQAEANTKIGGLSNDLNTSVAGLNKKIADTNDALTGTKGELSGAIAHTHDELVALAHKTDRDYYEFSLTRGKQQRVGNVQARLEKTNPKKNNFTVDLFFDDKHTTRKDQAMNSPVFFYMTGASSALEMVINKLDKDTISGYLSTPKGFFPAASNVLQSRPGGTS